MSLLSIRATFAALACAVLLLVGTAGSIAAQPDNTQNGLVNVNLQDLALAIPVSVAVPVGIAANVCNLSVIEVGELGDTGCTAENNSVALSKAIAVAMTDSGGGGGARNNQSGLVNVNVQELALAVPVSVAVPIGVAANVCNISVIEVGELGETGCDAENTSQGLSTAIARALAG